MFGFPLTGLKRFADLLSHVLKQPFAKALLLFQNSTADPGRFLKAESARGRCQHGVHQDFPLLGTCNLPQFVGDFKTAPPSSRRRHSPHGGGRHQFQGEAGRAAHPLATAHPLNALLDLSSVAAGLLRMAKNALPKKVIVPRRACMKFQPLRPEQFHGIGPGQPVQQAMNASVPRPVPAPGATVKTCALFSAREFGRKGLHILPAVSFGLLVNQAHGFFSIVSKRQTRAGAVSHKQPMCPLAAKVAFRMHRQREMSLLHHPPDRPGDPHADQPLLTAGPPPEQADATLILLHGRGATAQGILELGDELALQRLAILAPQAAGQTWYPHSFLAPLESNQPFLDSALGRLKTLVARLGSRGVPSERVALLGFSQGACLACEFVARSPRRYGAVMALTGGLVGPAGTPRDYSGSLADTPVFLGTSDPDPHVPVERVLETRAVLAGMGARVELRRYPGLPHIINADELQTCRDLLQRELLAQQGGG